MADGRNTGLTLEASLGVLFPVPPSREGRDIGGIPTAPGRQKTVHQHGKPVVPIEDLLGRWRHIGVPLSMPTEQREKRACGVVGIALGTPLQFLSRLGTQEHVGCLKERY